MIVDAHHHFWDPQRREYPWMGDRLAAIRRPFGPNDLRPLLKQNMVERTVLVQTVSSLEETAELLAIAGTENFIAGVVGWIDLTDGKAAANLARASGKLVGIRHQVEDEPDPHWLLMSAVQQSIRAIGEAGLVYDLLVRIDQLPAALETVRRHRHTRFVLDHTAKPRIAAGAWDREWERAVAPFADQLNVACKISGLVTEATWMSWTVDDLEPYVRQVIEWFGPERCIFGSDWPVCLLAASYDRVIGAMREIIGEESDVFGKTATRVYGLA